MIDNDFDFSIDEMASVVSWWLSPEHEHEREALSEHNPVLFEFLQMLNAKINERLETLQSQGSAQQASVLGGDDTTLFHSKMQVTPAEVEDGSRNKSFE